jgi:hypothetical protein
MQKEGRILLQVPASILQSSPRIYTISARDVPVGHKSYEIVALERRFSTSQLCI